jgi:hypothetical protein
MPFTTTWDATYESLPADNEDISAGAGRIRNIKVDLRERLKDVVTTASSGAAYTCNLATATVFNITLNNNCTFAFSGAIATGNTDSFTLILNQDAVGGRTCTWPAAVVWPYNVTPTLDTTLNTTCILVFMTINGGTKWYGSVVGMKYV